MSGLNLSMACPECGGGVSKVQPGETYITHDSTAVRRRRVCSSCGKSFKTLERIAPCDFIDTRPDSRLRDKMANEFLPVINRAPPKIGPQVATPVPPETVYPDGRIGWPDVFLYRWVNGHLRPVPPRLHVDSERHPKPRSLNTAGGLDVATIPYEIIVYDLPAFEALSASGRLRDPLHLGTPATPSTDGDGKASSPAATEPSPAAPASEPATNEPK